MSKAWDCPKCGHGNCTVPKYRSSELYAYSLIEPIKREWLAHPCVICGFELEEPCKDAKQK